MERCSYRERSSEARASEETQLAAIPNAPDRRFTAEIGELFVGIVEDIPLLLESHGDRVFVRIACA